MSASFDFEFLFVKNCVYLEKILFLEFGVEYIKKLLDVIVVFTVIFNYFQKPVTVKIDFFLEPVFQEIRENV